MGIKNCIIIASQVGEWRREVEPSIVRGRSRIPKAVPWNIAGLNQSKLPMSPARETLQPLSHSWLSPASLDFSILFDFFPPQDVVFAPKLPRSGWIRLLWQILPMVPCHSPASSGTAFLQSFQHPWSNTGCSAPPSSSSTPWFYAGLLARRRGSVVRWVEVWAGTLCKSIHIVIHSHFGWSHRPQRMPKPTGDSLGRIAYVCLSFHLSFDKYYWACAMSQPCVWGYIINRASHRASSLTEETDVNQRIAPTHANQNCSMCSARGPGCLQKGVTEKSELVRAGCLGENILDPTWFHFFRLQHSTVASSERPLLSTGSQASLLHPYNAEVLFVVFTMI